MNQASRLGQMLDPVADRLYIFATVLGLALRDIIPWWLAISLPLRDLLFTFTLPALQPRPFHPLPGPSPPRLQPAGRALPRQVGHVLPAVRVPTASARRRRHHPQPARAGLRLG